VYCPPPGIKLSGSSSPQARPPSPPSPRWCRRVPPALGRTPIKLLIESTDPPTLDSFPGALSQVLINLVTNALTHAFPSGQAGLITIRIGTGGPDQAELIVRDDGSGIAPDVLPKIFDPFFTTRRGEGGTGLGLHIVHNLVTGPLGGTLSVRTEPGFGTTFVVILPLSAPSRTDPVI
jgi:signal transduction histidine kinase